MGLKVSETYPSQYLTAADLNGKRLRVSIASVEEADVPDFNDKSITRRRLLLGFKGANKKMLLGSRNANILADAINDNCDSWVGQTIELFAQRESVAGTLKDVLKVSPMQEVASVEEGPGF